MHEPDILKRIEKAKAYFSGLYNCSQSVAIAFSDVIGIDEPEILRLLSGFGFGMGGERTVCGAVTGGAFVLSSLTSDAQHREQTYDHVKRLIDEFKEQHGGTVDCLDLIGKDPGHEEFHSICPGYIEKVIRIVETIRKE